jgi:hypothetical protein
MPPELVEICLFPALFGFLLPTYYRQGSVDGIDNCQQFVGVR